VSLRRHDQPLVQPLVDAYGEALKATHGASSHPGGTAVHQYAPKRCSTQPLCVGPPANLPASKANCLRGSPQLAGSGGSRCSSINTWSVCPIRTEATMSGANSASRRTSPLPSRSRRFDDVLASAPMLEAHRECARPACCLPTLSRRPGLCRHPFDVLPQFPPIRLASPSALLRTSGAGKDQPIEHPTTMLAASNPCCPNPPTKHDEPGPRSLQGNACPKPPTTDTPRMPPPLPTLLPPKLPRERPNLLKHPASSRTTPLEPAAKPSWIGEARRRRSTTRSSNMLRVWCLAMSLVGFVHASAVAQAPLQSKDDDITIEELRDQIQQTQQQLADFEASYDPN